MTLGKLAHGLLPLFPPVPQILTDDAQLRHILDDPLGSGVEAGDAVPGLGILDIGEQVQISLPT